MNKPHFIHPYVEGRKVRLGDSEVEIAPFCIIIQDVKLAPSMPRYFDLEIVSTVIGRDTDRKLDLRSIRSFSAVECEVRGLASVVRSCIADMVMHEVNECVLVGGARVFEPHENSDAQCLKTKAQNEL